MILRILHISDLHFRALEKDPIRSFNADLVAKSMLKAIEGLIKDNTIFDLVIVITAAYLTIPFKKKSYCTRRVPVKNSGGFVQKALFPGMNRTFSTKVVDVKSGADK